MATAFDTFSVSRAIRDAEVDERAADAITHAKMSELHHRMLTTMFGFFIGLCSVIVAAIKLL